MELPQPKLEKIPTFQSLKKGSPKYGSGGTKIKSKALKLEHANKFYRRGIAGSYKDEMNMLFQFLFWIRHGRQMKTHNYY